MVRSGTDAGPAWRVPEADQEALADAVSTARKDYGWAAGCVWRAGTRHDPLEVARRVGMRQDLPWRTVREGTAASGAVEIGRAHV